MFNSRNPKNAFWYYDDKMGGFRVDAFNSIKKGEEILYTYGLKSNYRFFLFYGFLDENNEYNDFPITIGIEG